MVYIVSLYGKNMDRLVWIEFWKCWITHEIHIVFTSLSSVQFSRSAMSDSLRPHEAQHTRPLCPSPTPGACSNSCPSSRWCHPTISSSVVPFASCLQSFPASRSFLRSQFFPSGGQSIGASASAFALPMNIQDWFPLGLTYVYLWLIHVDVWQQPTKFHKAIIIQLKNK